MWHDYAISQCCFKEVERSSILGSNLAQSHESGTSVVFLATVTLPPPHTLVLSLCYRAELPLIPPTPYRYGFSWSPCWPWTSVLLHSGLRKSWPASQCRYQVGDCLSNLLQSRLRQYGFVGVRALSRARRSVFLKEFVKAIKKKRYLAAPKPKKHRKTIFKQKFLKIPTILKLKTT